MTVNHLAGTRPRALTDLITYRHKGQLVYVPVAPDYNQALSHVRDAFPQLKTLHDGSISLFIPGHAEKCVGISAAAWPKLIAHLARYQIIDVRVTPTQEHAIPIPNITITYADAEDAKEMEPAPPYSGSEAAVEHEKAREPPRPRSPPAALHHKRSWFFQKLHCP